jgi:hypothetical protein
MIARITVKGVDSYLSSRFGYRIAVPANWKIIPRSDFDKIDKSLLTTDAEIAMINNDGTGYCLVIPEELKEYGRDYGAETLKNAVLETTRRVSGVEILEDRLGSPCGDAGFEIQYSVWSEGFHYRYMVLYSIYNRTGIQLLGWAFDSNAEKVFRDIKDNLAGRVEPVE